MELVGIVVIHYRGVAATSACLRSLERMRYDPYEIALVNNNPRDDLRTLWGRHPRIRVIDAGGNRGFVEGCRLGVEALGGRASHILFLNNDTVVEENFLGPLVDRFRRGDRVGIAAPKIYFTEGDRLLWAYGGRLCRFSGRAVHIGVFERDRGQYDRRESVDWISGCAMMVSRAMIDDVGMLDPAFFAYGEDLDWSLRARAKGYKLVVVPGAVVRHKGHASSARRFREYLLTRNHLRNLLKHRHSLRLCGAFAFAYASFAITRKTVQLLCRAALRLDSASLACAGGMMRGVVDFLLGRFGRPSIPED